MTSTATKSGMNNFTALLDTATILMSNPKGLLLKPNMVLPGLVNALQSSVEDVAKATVNCLRKCIPAAVAGVAFFRRTTHTGKMSVRVIATNEELMIARLVSRF